MYSMDEIFTRLQAGEKAEDIAKEMADNINGAIAKIEEEKAQAAKKTKVNEAAQRAADAFNELLDAYGVTKERMTAQDVVTLMEGVVELKTKVESLFGDIMNEPEEDTDAKIDKFLNAWGLK